MVRYVRGNLGFELDLLKVLGRHLEQFVQVGDVLVDGQLDAHFRI